MSDLTFDIEPSFWPVYERCKPFTMTSVERMYAMWSAVRHIRERSIPGDIVECGVWRGGSMMLAAATLLELGDPSRDLWLYDTFEGMTAPDAIDVQQMTGRPAADILAEQKPTEDDPFWAIAPLDEVKQNMTAIGYPTERLHFVVGKVEDTLTTTVPDRVALLRLDTDWYQSTLCELEVLYPKLTSRGLLIVDDYGYWRGAQEAVDRYFESRVDAPFLSRIDYTGRVGSKP